MDLKEHLLKGLRACKSSYLDDIRAMTSEQLGTNLGGTARTAYDFTFEVAFVNDRIAKRIRGEDPGPNPYQGWITAPEDFCTADAAAAQFETATTNLVDALEALPAEDLEKEINLPDGKTTTPLELATMCFSHMAYHDGQLNLIQAMNGDGEVHWKF